MNRTIVRALLAAVAAIALIGCSDASNDLDAAIVARNVADPYKVRYTTNADTFSNIATVCPDESHTIIVTSSDYAGYIFLPYCILDTPPDRRDPAVSSRAGIVDGGPSGDSSEVPR